MFGKAERNAQLFVDGCEVASNNNIVGGYSVGGILGGGSIFSTSVISNSVNRANISSFYAPCGGIVGSADSLFVEGCTNYGEIIANIGGAEGEAATKLGAGGIVGGSGAGYILSCSNYGNVQGHEGVGGIIGSTRISGNSEAGEDNCYSDVMIYNCDNEGAISGAKFVGGIAGEAQSTMYSVKNSAGINGNSYVGGIIGVAPVCAIHNAANIGAVVGSEDFVGGIVGNIIVGSLTSTQNFANVSTAGDYVGGLVGLSGSYFISHYCANIGNVSSTMQEAKIGGLVGEIGDPKSWTFSDTFRILASSMGAVFASLNVCGAFKIIALARSSSGNAFAVDYDLTFAQIGGLSEQSISALTSPLRAVISDGEYSEYISRMTSSNDQKINGMRDILSSTRSGYEIYQGFNQYNQDVLSYSTTEGSYENFFDNLTYKLNERGEEVAGMEKTDKWVHTAISGVCFVAGLTCGGIAALPAVGTSAAVFKLLSASCTALTVANSVYWSCTNFAQNTTIISQCVNSCTLQGEEKSSIGGLTGMTNEYTIISESLNLGSITESSNRDFGQITTKAKSRSIVQDIVLLGDKSWDNKAMESLSNDANVSDVYIWTNGETPIAVPYYSTIIYTPDELGNEKTYKGLSLSGSNARWIMSQYGELTIPVPYRSEFAEY